MSQRQRFTGKTALITGGGTGIGAAIAQQFASEGATVALCGRRSDVIQQKVDELTTAGYKAIAVVGDVATDATEIVQNALAALGRLDILVNNAAISAGVPMEEMDNQLWRQVLAVNLDGVFALSTTPCPIWLRAKALLHISTLAPSPVKWTIMPMRRAKRGWRA
ncbi:MAG: SDR family NAD(P)-dependent oxidoreductase [Caldilineaceae bacterium]